MNVRRLLGVVPVLLFVALVVLPGCGDDDRFECGKGSCLRENQVCLNGNGCTACAPAPSDCRDACGCMPTGTKLGDYECAEPFTCSGGDGERVMSCKTPKWVCG